MPESLVWWATVELIGAITFPIAFVSFRFLPDRGYSLAKILGLLLMTYGVWLGCRQARNGRQRVEPRDGRAIRGCEAIDCTATGSG